MKKYTLILFIILSAAAPVSTARGQEKETSPEHAYNKGIDFYNKDDYNKATDKFLEAFNTGSSKLEQWINYNLGNAAFEKGQKEKDLNPQESQQAYKKALEFFHRAIELDVLDQNAKHNYELTALKLKQAQQQQQENKEQQKEQQKEDKEQQQEDKEQQKEQQPKNKEEQDKQEQASNKQEQQDQKKRQQESQPQEMTEEQAKMLLENFQNSEDGPTELRILNSDAQDSGVEKDW